MSDNTQMVATRGASVTVGELRTWVERGPAPSILDVRPPAAFATTRIPGAVHAPVSEALIDAIPPHGLAVVVCEDGALSRDIVAALEAAGLRNAKYLAGGMAAWRERRAEGAERRKHARVPPLECRLTLKRAGWLAFLRPNLCARWLDVSEGGLGVLATCELTVGSVLRARLTNPGYGEAFDVLVVVRHVRPSGADEGRYVVGLEFVEPSALMRMCIRGLVDTGSMPPRHIVAAYARI
jgi:rhodanese-related sulfurtransferase